MGTARRLKPAAPTELTRLRHRAVGFSPRARWPGGQGFSRSELLPLPPASWLLASGFCILSPCQIFIFGYTTGCRNR